VASRRLGHTELRVSPIGYGAFKIGRNRKIKYPQSYDLPDEKAAGRLLHALLDEGVNYIDTAPAYGLSEERIGRALGSRRREFVLSTKVGEQFEAGQSHYDFSAEAVRTSVQRSLRRLRTDVIDIVYVHAGPDDVPVVYETDVVSTLQALRTRGWIRFLGFSGKSVQAERLAMSWADVLMVEYNLRDQSHAEAIAEAHARDLGVVVKKGLASGALPPEEAIRFVLSHAGVSSLLIGGLDLDHMRDNIRTAESVHR
jgi:aryl-alcohol dehydrogenase-like predicted oxidoreductase